MNVHELHTRLDAYLALREALGYATHATRRLLQDFVAYLAQHGDGPPIRATSRLTGPAARLPPAGPPDNTLV